MFLLSFYSIFENIVCYVGVYVVAWLLGNIGQISTEAGNSWHGKGN